MSLARQENSEQPIDWRVRMRTMPHGDTDWPHWVKWVVLTPTLLLVGFLVLAFGGIPLGMFFGAGVDEIGGGIWLILGCCLNLSMGLVGAIWGKVLGVSSLQIRIVFFLFTFFSWFFLASLLSNFIMWFV